MESEDELLAALLGGPRSSSDINLKPSTRTWQARRLERLGYIERKAGTYKLTKLGWQYVIEEKGMTPNPPAFTI